MIDIVIVCETEGCPKNGQIVNEVELLDCDLDTFMEAFGHGGEDDTDYCPECDELGVAYEELEWKGKQG